VEGATFQNVTLNGKPLTAADVKSNAFVKDLRVAP
jgi:hypothetical protein